MNPRPTHSFTITAPTQRGKISECYRHVEKFARHCGWQNGSNYSETPTSSNIYQWKSGNVTLPPPGLYDWYIRSRPDIYFVYPIKWPPPILVDGPSADVYAPITYGNLKKFAWSSHLTVFALIVTEHSTHNYSKGEYACSRNQISRS